MNESDYTLYSLNVQLLALPPKIGATVTVNEDGSYTMFVNKNITYESQKKAALHELEHVKRGHFLYNKSADELELETNE